MEGRQVSTETLAVSPYTLVEISGLAFTSAGVVTSDAAVEAGSSSTTTGSGSSKIMSTATGSASTTKSNCVKLDLGLWGTQGIAIVMGVVCYLV